MSTHGASGTRTNTSRTSSSRRSAAERLAALEARMQARQRTIDALYARVSAGQATDNQRYRLITLERAQGGDRARGEALRSIAAPLGVETSTRRQGSASPFISPAGVRAWTRGNAPGVPAVGYHFAPEEALDNIKRQGVDVAREVREYSDAYYGRGFYMYAIPQEPFGDHPHYVSVALRMRNPLVMDSEMHAQETMDSLVRSYLTAHPDERPPRDWSGALDPHYAELVTREALARGYDGIVMTAAQFGTEVVAIKPGTARVIRG